MMPYSSVLFLVFFFFFSSRRRHTRLVSDWSSDVCSSDLGVRVPERQAVPRTRGYRAGGRLSGALRSAIREDCRGASHDGLAPRPAAGGADGAEPQGVAARGEAGAGPDRLGGWTDRPEPGVRRDRGAREARVARAGVLHAGTGRPRWPVVSDHQVPDDGGRGGAAARRAAVAEPVPRRAAVQTVERPS